MIVGLFEAILAEGHAACVVGAGPVGLALGLALARLGLKVLVLESGSLDGRGSAAALLARTERVNPERHASSDETVRRGLGGASRVWGAGCTPYDPIDFRPRPELGIAGAPIGFADLAPYHQPAAEYFGCGSPAFDLNDDAPGSPLRSGQVTRFARQADMGLRHRPRIEALPNLTVCLNTTVTRLDLDPGSGAVRGVEVRSGGRTTRFATPGLVLACGGIEAARLLLCAQREHPALLGGDDGPLGRYYMGHMSGSIARIRFATREMGMKFDFQRNGDGTYHRRRITFAEEVLEAQRLLNVYFLPSNIPIGDSAMGSGALSALHLGLSTWHRSVHYLRHYQPGYRPDRFHHGLDAGRHLGNILGAPIETLSGLAAIARQRLDRRKRPPGFYYAPPSRTFALRYHSEHAPDPDSRVTLADRSDAHGVPLPRVDLKFGPQDIGSVIRAHGVLDQLLRQTGWGQMHWSRGAAEIAEHVESQASDGYHQIGLTRMSHSARDGVVDRNLAVHGFRNLWIAGTGVLPTGGQAHPTFGAVALALRLAEHIAAIRAAAAVRATATAGLRPLPG